MTRFPGFTNLEQLLLLQGSCSNVRAFTRCTYPVFSLPARRTITRYRADTDFLDENSRPHLRARVYTKRRKSKSTLQSYGVTAVDYPSASHLRHTLTSRPSSSTERAASIAASDAFTQRRIGRATKNPPGSRTYRMAGNFGGKIFWRIAENMSFGGVYFGS